METTTYERRLVDGLSRNWWAVVLRGVAAVIFGILAFVWPGITATVLVIFFGAYALWDGIFALIAAFRSQGDRRWALVLEGIAGILAGIIALFLPGIAALSLLYLIAAWAIITGIMEIVAAVRLRKEIEGELLLMLSGLLSVVFGVFAMLRPAAGVLAITWVIASYAILFGILLIILGFRLRSWKGDRLAPAAP
ncbi:MAG: HdeD family acid-resistance protein [Bacteroidota bacterium]